MARKFKTPITIDELGSASSQALAANVDGDSQNRINIDAGGKITWGSGSATGDTTLYRSAADTLKTDDAFTATSLAITGQFTLPTSDGSADQVITTNGSGTLSWADVAGGATVSDTAPSSPSVGDIWFESDTGDVFVYYDSAWIDIGGTSVANISMSDTAPSSPANGDIWFKTDTGKTFVYYDDGSSQQWVEIGAASSSASGSAGAVQFADGNGAFSSDASNLFWDDTNNRLGIGTTTPGKPLHVDGGSEQLELSTSTNTAARASIVFDPDGTEWHLGARGSTGNPDNSFYLWDNANSAYRLVVDPDGKVGIGTQSPASLLEVSSATGTTPTSPTEVRISTSTDGGSWSTTAPWGQLSFYSADSSNNGAKVQAAVATTPIESFGGLGRLGLWTHDGTSLQERLSVTNSGNVGIGTTTPATTLDVRGTTDVHGNINMRQSNNSSSINWHDTLDGTFWHLSGPRTGNNNLNLYWNDGSTYHMVAAFDENKRLGIGTESPQTALEVVNGIITSRSQAGGQNTVPTDRGIALVCADMNTTSQFTPGLLFGSTDGQFTTNNPKYNAGIFGRADQTYSADTGTGMSVQIRFAGTNAGTGHGVTGAYGYAFGPGTLHSMVDNHSDLGLSVRRWDDVYATNGTIQTSDERDKANVTDLTLGLAFVDSLRPVSYTWNDRSGYVGTREHMGFVAQEIAAVLGDDAADLAVWTHTEATEETDEEGNTVTTVDRQGLRYNELMAPMVKAIQELSATVQTLTDRIEALEAE